jgi:hypothetical protein
MIKERREMLELEIALYEQFEKLYENNKNLKQPHEVLEWLQDKMENAAQEVCDEKRIDLW